jgi:hypothetical protein
MVRRPRLTVSDGATEPVAMSVNDRQRCLVVTYRNLHTDSWCVVPSPAGALSLSLQHSAARIVTGPYIIIISLLLYKYLINITTGTRFAQFEISLNTCLNANPSSREV